MGGDGRTPGPASPGSPPASKRGPAALRGRCAPARALAPAGPSTSARVLQTPAPTNHSAGVRPRLLSVREAACYVGISHWTLRQKAWEGELPEVRLGRRLLFDLRDLDAWIERSKHHRGIR